MNEEINYHAEPTLCFIITQKYSRNCPSYIKNTIDNIKNNYTNYFIIIVDNNSENIEDIYNLFLEDTNLKILINNSESKYELGGYIYGIKWLIEQNYLNYDYYVFLQDTLVFMKKYDFNNLKKENIKATSIIVYDINNTEMGRTGYLEHEKKTVLEPLGLYNRLDEILLCWGSNFIIHNEKLLDLYNYIKNIILTTKRDSESSERYMGRIIYELNNHSNFNIDGFLDDYYSKIDANSTELNWNNNLVYFQKKHQYFMTK